MKKHGKKLTKRLTAFLMSFVMVMSLVTITKPIKVQAAYMFKYSPGSPLIWTNGGDASQLHEWSSDVYCVFVQFPDNPEIYADDTKGFTFNYSSTQTNISYKKKGTLSLSAGLYQVTKLGGNTKLYIDPVESWQVTYKYIDDSTSTENIYRYPHYSGSPYANVPVYGNNTSASLKTLAAVQGYTHGWYTQANGGDKKTSLPTSTTTLYERLIPYTYKVAFNANQPSGAPSNVTGTMSNQSFTYDTAQSLTTNQYSLEGYEFKGWNTQANGSGASYADGAEVNNLTATNNGTVTLYAQWETLPFEVTLNSGDATYPGTKTIQEKFGTGYYLNKSYTKVMTTNANKILIPKKDGYDFAGYYTEQGGSGTQIINANGYITGEFTANTELYAHWTAKSATYTIQYHANGGTPIAEAVTSQNRFFTVEDDTFSLKPMSDMFEAPVSSTGQTCEFLGWATSPSSAQAEYTDNASVSDFTDVDGATIHLYAVWRSTLPTSIQNGSFESPAIGSWYSIMPDTTNSIAWKTTASDHKIEFGRPSKNMSAANSAYHTTTVVDGYQFAELCANQVGALYQTVSTFSGNMLKWGFSHRGRSGDDTMELWIGTPDDVTAVLEYYTSHNNSVAGISEDAELSAKYNTISQNGDGSTRSYTDGNTQWNSYTGDYVVPDGQIETTFAFVSISASGNKISFGNLLDNVYFTAEVPPKTQLFEYDATNGGVAVAQVNGIATSGKEAFVRVGSTIEIYPAANEGYTYNGGFVNGSYKSVDGLPLRYTVSDADTSLKKITLLFSKDSTIIFDKEGGNYEDDEYDLKASGNNQYYTLKANPTKEGYSFDKWIIAGSNVTLTEGNYIAYETDADSKTYIRVYNSASDTTTPLYECESEFGINLIATYIFTAFPSAKVSLSMEGGNVAGESSLTYELDKFDLSDSATQNDIIEYSAMTLPTPTKGVYAFKGWKIGDKVYDAGTQIKYAISTTNENGTVMIGDDTQSAITTDTTYTLLAQWETIPMEGVTASGVTKVYDGNLSDVITVSGLPAGATVTYGTSEDDCNLSACPKYTNAGVYKVYYKVSADGYTDYKSSADITINPKPVSITWSSQDEFTYDNSEHSVVATVNNGVGDDSFTISYESDGNNVHAATDAGEYTAKVTGVGNANYTVVDGENVSKEWKISYLVTDADISVTGDKKNPSSNWYTGNVTMKPDAGYLILKDGETQWQNELVITDEGRTSVTYQLKDSTGYITEPRTKDICIDRLSPNGEISVGSDNSNKWNSFLNFITFGQFFKETQVVKISGTDVEGGSGVDKLYYYVSETALTQEQVCALGDSDWKGISNHGTFTIDPERKLIIYAKIIDDAGNVTYISSDGLVFDMTAPTITGVIDGTVYCENKTITVADTNLANVTVNGTVVTLSDNGQYELNATNAWQTIVATDKAGNSTTIKVTINDRHNWNEPEFTWSNGNKSCLATWVCKHDAGHVESKECTVTSEYTKQATGTEKGEITYTAKVTIDGTEYTGTKKVETAVIESEKVGTGTLTTEVMVAEDVPKSTITGLTTDVAKEILTSAELAAVQSGEDVLIYLEATNIDNTVPAKDKTESIEKFDTVVEQMIADNPKLTSKKEVDTKIRFIDLSLFKKIGDEESIRLYETGSNKIKVTIEVPEDMRSDNKERVYKVIRVHYSEGSTAPLTEIVDSTYDSEHYTLTFETDKFSTYAIAYAEPNGFVAVINVSLDKDKASITTEDGFVQLTATVTPDTATNKNVIWTSSNTKVATVDANGKVTAVADGRCTIIVSTADGGKTASCTITVDIEEDAEENAVNVAPNTSDNNNPALMMVMMLMSLLTLAGLSIKRKRI